MKCNRKGCSNDEELHWTQPHKDGNVPVRLLDGKKHYCSLSMSINVDEIPDTPSVYLCNICKKPVDFVCQTCGHVQVIDCK